MSSWVELCRKEHQRAKIQQASRDCFFREKHDERFYLFLNIACKMQVLTKCQNPHIHSPEGLWEDWKTWISYQKDQHREWCSQNLSSGLRVPGRHLALNNKLQKMHCLVMTHCLVMSWHFLEPSLQLIDQWEDAKLMLASFGKACPAQQIQKEEVGSFCWKTESLLQWRHRRVQMKVCSPCMTFCSLVLNDAKPKPQKLAFSPVFKRNS